MQQNIIPATTCKLSFKVQFFAETYFFAFSNRSRKKQKLDSRENFWLYGTYDKRKTPIDFQGQGSKVKVTRYTLLLNLKFTSWAYFATLDALVVCFGK